LHNRIRNEELRKKVVTAEEAAAWIKDGMNVAISGFAVTGNPKVVLPAWVHHIQMTGDERRISLWTGASTSQEVDGILGAGDYVVRRFPYQSTKEMRNRANQGSTCYIDMHLSMSAQSVRYGWWGNLDIAIVEAAGITETGELILTAAVGNTTTFVSSADKVIIEVNTASPESFEGIHDLYDVEDPPHRQPIPIIRSDQRIGTIGLHVPAEKILGIVLSHIPEKGPAFAPVEPAHEMIAEHIIHFLEHEIQLGRMPEPLLPLQSGVGNVANAVLAGLAKSRFSHLQVYSEVLQDSVLTLLESGKLDSASGCALNLSGEAMLRMYANMDQYREKIVLRPLEITNHPEIVRRLGVIAMNTALEADIYGNVNSTHVMGTRIMNGIGGSGDFARNSYLAFFITESIAKGGDISCIVPFVSHTDHTEHDVDVIVTEQGVADLRGLAPRERAARIIENCAHPQYRDALWEYFHGAETITGGQTPHILDESLYLAFTLCGKRDHEESLR